MTRASPPPGSSASLVVRTSRVPGGRGRLARDLDRLLAFVAARAGRLLEVAYVVVGDAEMAGLHERHLGLPGPTDVLAFPLAQTPVLQGDVVVSADTARREAAARGHAAYDELLLYAVHGTLHLVGHDDHDAKARRRMRRAERQVLASLGRPAVFSKKRPGRDAP